MDAAPSTNSSRARSASASRGVRLEGAATRSPLRVIPPTSPGIMEVVVADKESGRAADDRPVYQKRAPFTPPRAERPNREKTGRKTPRVTGRAGAYTLDPPTVADVEARTVRRERHEAHQ